ncbi:MAG: hypothetical protein ABJF10_21850 [Chthoniobacter sp.]|uniref:hypothetical protein n=1 Tax=Chthoniobacter sp. TaxID=2510640 RepID=UPI0032A684E5
MPDFFSAPVLGIDLGASFTKISYRPGWTRGRRYEQPCCVVMIENQALVPSLVIHRKGARKPWLCGQTAANYRPVEGDQVFTNWKSDLFSSELTLRVGGSLKAAGEFFRWLHDQVTAAGIDVAACRVKVCLPAFPDIEGPASILGQQMEFAGWQNATVSRVAEPRANTVGVFGEGRNTLYRQDVHREVNPIYMEMYPQGSTLLNHLRSFGLNGGPRHASIVIVDIGSFTTDLSIVDFDAGADGDCIASTEQTSYKVGIIGGFELPLLEHLSSRHGFKLGALTFEDREAIKRALANGESFVLTIPGNRNIRLGDSTDQQSAGQIAGELANRVWDSYRAETAGKQVKYLILTGGGSVAPLVRDAIHARFSRTRVNWVDAEGMETSDGKTGDLRRWPDTGETLARLATAVGASSVILDLPAGSPLREEKKSGPVQSPWISCTCQGGNKECMRCGGRGMYLPQGR